MKLTRRGFFKTLGCGILAAIVPSALLKQKAKEAPLQDDYLTDDTIWMLPEDAKNKQMILFDNRQFIGIEDLADAVAEKIKKDEKDIVWSDNRRLWRFMAE